MKNKDKKEIIIFLKILEKIHKKSNKIYSYLLYNKCMSIKLKIINLFFENELYNIGLIQNQVKIMIKN